MTKKKNKTDSEGFFKIPKIDAKYIEKHGTEITTENRNENKGDNVKTRVIEILLNAQQNGHWGLTDRQIFDALNEKVLYQHINQTVNKMLDGKEVQKQKVNFFPSGKKPFSRKLARYVGKMTLKQAEAILKGI